MIQLSFTKDYFTPNAVWFARKRKKPKEYNNYFKHYQYLTAKEALEMLDDEFVTDYTKREIKRVLTKKR